MSDAKTDENVRTVRRPLVNRTRGKITTTTLQCKRFKIHAEPLRLILNSGLRTYLFFRVQGIGKPRILDSLTLLQSNSGAQPDRWCGSSFDHPPFAMQAATATPAPRLGLQRCHPMPLNTGSTPNCGGNRPRLHFWNQHNGSNAHTNPQSQASTCTAAGGTSPHSHHHLILVL